MRQFFGWELSGGVRRIRGIEVIQVLIPTPQAGALLRGVTHSVDEEEASTGNLPPVKEEIKPPELCPHLWSVRERRVPCGFSMGQGRSCKICGHT